VEIQRKKKKRKKKIYPHLTEDMNAQKAEIKSGESFWHKRREKKKLQKNVKKRKGGGERGVFHNQC